MAEVEIKALEWLDMSYPEKEHEEWIAHTPFWTLMAYRDRTCEEGWQWVAKPFPPEASNYPTKEAAQEALTRHYEARIRSVIVPATPMQNLHDAPAEVKPVERYSLYARNEIVNDADGRWVRYDDHASALLAERARAEKAEQERDEAKEGREEARKTAGKLFEEHHDLYEKLKAAEADKARLREALSSARTHLSANVDLSSHYGKGVVADIDAALSETSP